MDDLLFVKRTLAVVAVVVLLCVGGYAVYYFYFFPKAAPTSSQAPLIESQKVNVLDTLMSTTSGSSSAPALSSETKAQILNSLGSSAAPAPATTATQPKANTSAPDTTSASDAAKLKLLEGLLKK